MKRIFFASVFAFAAFVFFAGTGTEAVDRQFAERFVVNGETNLEGNSGTYNFDKAHTFIGFKIKHMGLIDVPGFFRDFTGTVNYNEADPSKSSVEFTAQMTSVDTGVEARDNHLRNPDFFEVAKFPTMTFKSTKVEKKGKGWTVTGDLTMKGVTKSVAIPFNLTGFLPGNQRNGPRMGITGETTINRRDFGVNYGSNLPGTNTPVLADEVKVVLQIEAIQPKEAPKPAGE